jgi:hypothetical protein
MAFLFNNSNVHQLSHPLPSEPVSIGCEAWIDVGRFCAAEQSLRQTTATRRTSGDHSRSAHSRSPLTKSLADIRRKLWQRSTEDLD